MKEDELPNQPEVNIGTLGHVDNGKSTIVQSITGIWTGRHSEELKRGITIKIGYADAAIYKCPNCPPPQCYTTKKICPHCKSETIFQRAISFIDCPGHHSLMVTMLSGAALFDGAILVADAHFHFPQLQDKEHLLAATIMDIKKIIITQNKIDIVSMERAMENYKEIINGVKGTAAENAPIIPVSGQHGANIDALLWAIEKYIPTPQRDLSKPYRMPILRSFDINLPGEDALKLRGGVIGGSITQGTLKIEDEIEIAPGLPIKEGDPKSEYSSLFSEVVNIKVGNKNLEIAKSGGLIGIETKLDPSLTKSDGLVGNIAGKPGTLPPTRKNLILEYKLFEKVIGIKESIDVKPLEIKETLVLNAYSAVTSGIIKNRKKDIVEIELNRPLCIEDNEKVVISRKIGLGWRLIGYGKVIGE